VGSGSTLSHSFTPGSHTVTVKAVDDDGDSDTRSMEVDMNNAAPSVTLVGPDALNTNDTGQFDADADDPDGPGSELVYDWEIDSGSGSGSTVYESWDSEGSYSVEVTVEDKWGKTTTKSITVTVKSGGGGDGGSDGGNDGSSGGGSDGGNSGSQTNDPTATFTLSQLIVCHGYSVTVNPSGSHDNDQNGDSIMTTRWKVNGQLTAVNDGTPTESFTLSQPGTTTITLIVIDDENDKDTVEKTVTVQSGGSSACSDDQAPVAAITRSPTGEVETGTQLTLWSKESYDPDNPAQDGSEITYSVWEIKGSKQPSSPQSVTFNSPVAPSGMTEAFIGIVVVNSSSRATSPVSNCSPSFT